MKRTMVFVFLVGISAALVCDEAWARGGRSHGRHGFHHRSHARTVIVAPFVVPRFGYRYGGVGVLPYGYPLAPAIPGVIPYRYYCNELDRYYPDVTECPSGFGIVTPDPGQDVLRESVPLSSPDAQMPDSPG